MSADLLTEFKAFSTGVDNKLAGLAVKTQKIEDAIAHFEADMQRPVRAPRVENKSLDYIRSKVDIPDVKHLLKVRRGRLIIPVEGGFFGETKTTLTSGSLPASERDTQIVGLARRALRIRDIVGSGPQIATNSFDFIKETGFTNGASPQVEGSSKGQSDITFSTASADVTTLAHWTRCSTQVIDDVSGLSTFINGRMLYGLKLVEETQLLAGDGTGVNLSGMVTQANTYNTGYNIAGDTKLDKVRHFLLQLEVANFEPDGIVLNPRDWHDIELIKDENGASANTGNYIVGDPLGDGQIVVPTLWRRSVILSNSISYGYCLVGAFASAAEIRDRQQATIDISFEDGDNFVKNLVTIRCEERLTMAVKQPEAFIYGAL